MISLKSPVFKDRKTYLYKEGDECSELTGGWISYPYALVSSYTYGNATFNDDNIVLSPSSEEYVYESVAITTTNTIDLSEFTTFKIELMVSSATEWARVGFRSVNTGVYDNTFDVLLIGDTDLPTTRTVLSYSLSSYTLTSPLYVFVGIHKANPMTIYNIWLE